MPRDAGAEDKTRLGGGLGLPSPFGTFYVPNISPDPDDGIGKWSEADFVTAMLKGTSPDGRHYFPAFPYAIVPAHEDRRRARPVRASQDAAAGERQSARPRRVVSVQHPPHARRLETPVPRRQAVSARPGASRREWNRGAYLVNGPGHCAECHSPRNALGGIVAAQRFAGGPDPEGKGWVPNITQQSLKDYSEKDIAYLLETGNTPDGDLVGGSMAAVIRNTSQLTPQDRAAMAAYIKSLTPVEGPKPPPKKQ